MATVFDSPSKLKEESIRYKSAISSLKQQIRAEKISARKEKRVADITGMETDIMYSKKEASYLSEKAKAIEKKKTALKKKVSKMLKSRVLSRKVMKPSRTTVTIKEREPTNIFHEESRFFKSELANAKREMFL